MSKFKSVDFQPQYVKEINDLLYDGAPNHRLINDEMVAVVVGKDNEVLALASHSNAARIAIALNNNEPEEIILNNEVYAPLREAMQKEFDEGGITCDTIEFIHVNEAPYFKLVVSPTRLGYLWNVFFKAGSAYACMKALADLDAGSHQLIPGAMPVGTDMRTDFQRDIDFIAKKHGFIRVGEYRSFGELVSPHVTLQVKHLEWPEDQNPQTLEFQGKDRREALGNFEQLLLGIE